MGALCGVSLPVMIAVPAVALPALTHCRLSARAGGATNQTRKGIL